MDFGFEKQHPQLKHTSEGGCKIETLGNVSFQSFILTDSSFAVSGSFLDIRHRFCADHCVYRFTLALLENSRRMLIPLAAPRSLDLSSCAYLIRTKAAISVYHMEAKTLLGIGAMKIQPPSSGQLSTATVSTRSWKSRADTYVSQEYLIPKAQSPHLGSTKEGELTPITSLASHFDL